MSSWFFLSAMERFNAKIVGNVLIGPPMPKFIDDDLVKGLYERLCEAGDQVLLTNSATGETRTGNQILRDVKTLVANFRDLAGVSSGDVVVVASENNLEIDAVIIALWILGAVYGAVNPLYTTCELIQILGIMRPKVVLCSENALKTVTEIRSQVQSIQTLISYGTSGADLTMDQMLDGKHPDVDWRIPTDPDSVAALLTSSGTTGVPKCVELTHKNFQSCLDSLFLYDPKPDPPRTTALFLPQYHGFGMLLCLDGILRRNHLVVFPRFEILNFLECCEKFKINVLLVVPPILVLLAKHPQVLKTDLSAVIEIRSGAAAVKPSLVDEVLRRTKNAVFYEGYGLTESCIIASFPVLGQPRGSVGMVGAGMEIKVVDVATGEILGAHQEGELWLKGNQIMKGYKDNPGATTASLDSDGWFHTGDIGYYDEDGWLYVRDRIKELIKYNAMQVSPSELEALVLRHPSVRDVAVWGKPDEAAGQLPMALVVPEPGVEVTPEEIQKFVAEHVSSHKKLRGGVVFVKEIPKTPSGKILRRLLPTLFDA